MSSDQVRVVQMSSIWKAVGVLTAIVAVGMTAHGLFVIPSFLNASREQTERMIKDHALYTHPGSASAAEVSNLRAKVDDVQSSVQTLLIEQGRAAAKLESISEDLRDLKKNK